MTEVVPNKTASNTGGAPRTGRGVNAAEGYARSTGKPGVVLCEPLAPVTNQL